MDVCVTVPKKFGLAEWIAEGDPAPTEPGPADAPWSGQEWHFYLGGAAPRIEPGERVYVVYDSKLRGFAPLMRVEWNGRGFSLVRHGGAEAVTIDEVIRSFRGWRYLWWERDVERPFPNWTEP